MSQNNEGTAECGADSAALHSAGRSSGRPEHCLHLNVNSYIELYTFFKCMQIFSKQQFIFALLVIKNGLLNIFMVFTVKKKQLFLLGVYGFYSSF